MNDDVEKKIARSVVIIDSSNGRALKSLVLGYLLVPKDS